MGCHDLGVEALIELSGGGTWTCAYCGGQVEGTDVVAQVQAKTGDKVSFIHQEVYVDNDVNKGIRPQLTAFHLQSEPWTYVIDRTGRISSRFEGALSADELQRAVAKVER